jgi:hypothetical protein
VIVLRDAGIGGQSSNILVALLPGWSTVDTYPVIAVTQI